MASSSSDDDKNDLWSWSEKQFQNLKAEHDRFFYDLKQESKRLEKELAIDDTRATKSPFAAFKRFVDTNIGSLSSSFNVKSGWKKEMERREAEELDISYRWTGSLEHPDDIERDMSELTEYDRAAALESLDRLLTEAEERNAGVPQHKKDALWHDPDSQWGYLDLLGFQAEERDGVTGKILEALGTQPRWLSVDWFKRSSYSPVRLEAYSELNGSGHRWRAAFEDLLSASLDKPMHSDVDARFTPVGARTPFGRPQSIYHGPGLDWMLSLLCRGILPGFYLRSINGSIGDITRYWIRANHGLSFLTPYECANWQIRGKLPSDPGAAQDMADLLKEIATRATSDRATSDSQVAPALEKAGITVEQDLYDALHARIDADEHYILAREDVPVAEIQTAPKARQNDSNAQVKKAMKPRIDEAIESGRVQRAWIDFLDRMRPGVDIMILYREDENKRSITSPGPPPQPFLQLVVASLAASRCEFAELNLQHCTQSSLVWQNIDSWKGLELGGLKSLRVALTIKDFMRRRSDSEKHLRNLDLESACVLRNLLRKSGSTLQSLTIETDTPSLICSTSLPTLPALRFLMLSQITNVNADELASWIARLQTLKTLVLRYVGLKDHKSMNDWLAVFCAVRDHHGGVQFTSHSDFIPGQHLMFSHQCGSRTNIENDPPGYSCYNGVKVLKQYLSGARDWPNIPP